jgi:hypothetical protein
MEVRVDALQLRRSVLATREPVLIQRPQLRALYGDYIAIRCRGLDPGGSFGAVGSIPTIHPGRRKPLSRVRFPDGIMVCSTAAGVVWPVRAD